LENIKNIAYKQLQQIAVIGFMDSWFYIWDDLLRLLAIARVANPQIEFNLIPNPLHYQNVDSKFP
jgi:hypothetical protein